MVTRMRKRMPDDEAEEVEKAARAQPYEEVDYLTWLAQFERFHEVPRFAKYAVPEYWEYLENLSGYLTGAFERFFPGWVLPTHKEPLFCLPTNRLFVSEGTRNSHMAGKMYKKKLAAMQKLPLAEQTKVTDETIAEDKKIAMKECLIQKMRDIFSDILDATTANLQKKQSRTVEEMEAALEELEDL